MSIITCITIPQGLKNTVVMATSMALAVVITLMSMGIATEGEAMEITMEAMDTTRGMRIQVDDDKTTISC